MTRLSSRMRLLFAGLLLVLLAAGCQLTPVTGPGSISLGGGVDVAALGYVQSEFFMAGPATSYGSAGPLTSDGQWTVVPDSGVAGYKTRLVVHRPADAADFNGTVIVEWMNVTARSDLPIDWVFAHTELVRDGFAWVGVSAQSVGVNQLRNSNPARYGSLRHPGDSYSYDIFTQAGLHVRDNKTLLGGLVPEQIIATGESQSASRLVTYINAMHLRRPLFDGYLVHSRSGSSSSLRQEPLGPVPAPAPALIRNDLDVPVMVVQAEGDVIGSNLAARQPDTPRFRSWEMAGTSHVDSYVFGAGAGDIGDGNAEIEMFELMRNPANWGCANLVNAGPHSWILRSAVDGLETWVRTGTPPAAGPLLEVVSDSPVVLARDAQGNALGGIRSPHVDAPVATLLGTNTGPGFCRLLGSTFPLTTAELTALYPTHADFVDAWSAALDDAVANGYILAADADALLAAAQGSSIPN